MLNLILFNSIMDSYLQERNNTKIQIEYNILTLKLRAQLVDNYINIIAGPIYRDPVIQGLTWFI